MNKNFKKEKKRRLGITKSVHEQTTFFLCFNEVISKTQKI